MAAYSSWSSETKGNFGLLSNCDTTLDFSKQLSLAKTFSRVNTSKLPNICMLVLSSKFKFICECAEEIFCKTLLTLLWAEFVNFINVTWLTHSTISLFFTRATFKDLLKEPKL